VKPKGAGEYQTTLDLLDQIVRQRWNSRLPETEWISLAETNHFIATYGQFPDFSNFDKRLIRNLAVHIKS